MFSSSPALANIFFKKVSQISPPKDYEKSEKKNIGFQRVCHQRKGENQHMPACHFTSLLKWMEKPLRTKSFCQLIICELENISWGPIKNHLVNMFILGMLSLKNNHYYQTFFMIIITIILSSLFNHYHLVSVLIMGVLSSSSSSSLVRPMLALFCSLIIMRKNADFDLAMSVMMMMAMMVMIFI